MTGAIIAPDVTSDPDFSGEDFFLPFTSNRGRSLGFAGGRSTSPGTLFNITVICEGVVSLLWGEVLPPPPIYLPSFWVFFRFSASLRICLLGLLRTCCQLVLLVRALEWIRLGLPLFSSSPGRHIWRHGSF